MEQQPQAQPAEAEQQRVKTLGVRIDEDLHAQLTFIAQLTGSTIADQIRHSIEARVKAAQEDPDLIARAEEVRAEIEREAQARQQAIAGLFGKAALSGEVAPPESTARRGRRANTPAAE
jgi:predicted DNA-binding protein